MMKKITLTFDDVPTHTTLELIQILVQNQIPATMFVWGERAIGKEDILRFAYEKGIVLGNHTYLHGHGKELPINEWLEEIRQTDLVIKKATNNVPIYFRPPFGEWTLEMKQAIKKKMVLWDLDSFDWKTRNTKAIVEEVVTKAKENDIVLLHDLPETIQALPIIIEQLKEKGFDFVPLDQLLPLKE